MLACWLALQRILRLLDDAETAALVKGLLKKSSGIARLADEAWLGVSAPHGLAARRHVGMFGLPGSASCGCSTTPRPRRS